MKASPAINSIAAVLVLLLLVAAANVSEAGTCNPSALSPCAGAINSSSQPTAQCCSAIKAQKSCYCQYAKNPQFKKIVTSPGAKKVVKTCGVTFPKC